jgi:23S rRNA (cytidine1920-2'-O)/16S rRNA (cytidine1409-2'-O)-methyltransferase
MSGPGPRARLDRELVRRGLAPSRVAAQEAIAAGQVTVDGAPARKPSTLVGRHQDLVVLEAARRWVSRGGDKLEAALDALDIPVTGRVCLDAGASTGGFTDVLLARGARTVVAVDVGYGQLAWKLRNDPRVIVLERTHVRDLTAELLGGVVPELVVADLSFISLATVLPVLRAVAGPGADWCCLVKPQFEAGPGLVGRGGVVRDSAGWVVALDRVARAAGDLGLAVMAGAVSALPGPAGNIEFFLWLAGVRASESEPVGGDVAGVRASDGEPVGGDMTGWSAVRDRLVDEGLALRAADAGRCEREGEGG